MKYTFLLVLLLACFVVPMGASAHERQQFRINGELYEFVIGSLNEPIAVDDKTGVDFRASKVESHADMGHAGHGTAPAGAIVGLESTLKVEMIAGGAKKVTDLSPVHGTPGAYKNTFYPTVATSLSYRIFGTIEGTPIDLTFSCTPAGHARAEEDATEIKVSDSVTRTLKTGSFGCPVAKESLGFPEASSNLYEVATDARSGTRWGIAGSLIGVAGLLAALSRRRRS
jgi:hypothetical protein